jgi:hypothetical protein
VVKKCRLNPNSSQPPAWRKNIGTSQRLDESVRGNCPAANARHALVTAGFAAPAGKTHREKIIARIVPSQSDKSRIGYQKKLLRGGHTSWRK